MGSFRVQEPLISKSDSANAVSRVSSVVGNSWKFSYYLKDICNILVLIFLVQFFIDLFIIILCGDYYFF